MGGVVTHSRMLNNPWGKRDLRGVARGGLLEISELNVKIGRYCVKPTSDRYGNFGKGLPLESWWVKIL